MSKIILASASPRRKLLLQWADVKFEVMSIPTDESYPDGLTPAEQTIHIAKNKAIAVVNEIGTQSFEAIIAADTVVVLDGTVIGKPKDRREAIATLEALSGQIHTVITGVYIAAGGEARQFYETTDVVFHPLSRGQIEYYVDKYHPYDKAGAYAIQEWIGVVGVKAIRGDFYNVMGLPVSRVLAVLRELNVRV